MKKTFLYTLLILATILVFAACEHNHPEKKFDPRSIPLTIEFYGLGGKVVFENAPSNLKYSINDGRIQQLGKDNDTIALGDTQKVSLYLTRSSSSVDKPLTINCEGSDCYVYGNVMSLYSESNYENMDYVYPYAFKGLFCQNQNIKNHPEYDIYLPATKLKEHCYDEMFKNCTNITKAPELPATTLAESCYESMFQGCKNLESAPDLTVTVLTPRCYKGMFEGCESLVSAPRILAEKMNTESCDSMFASCKSLKVAPELLSTELAEGCYKSMFEYCKNLTGAPVLPAKTLAKECYANMFANCRSLTTAPTLPATTLAEGCYRMMFYSCKSLTTAPTLPATMLASSCYESMFEECSSLTVAPVLPATKLVNNCYLKMFRNCVELAKITCLATDISASSATHNWVGDYDYSCSVADSGTFVKAKDVNWPKGKSGVPSGWKVVEQ